MYREHQSHLQRAPSLWDAELPSDKHGAGDGGAVSSAGQPSTSRAVQIRATQARTRNPGKVRVKASARRAAPAYTRNSVAIGAQMGQWRAYHDPRTNLKYYFNATTGKTSWDPPRSFT